MNESSSPPERSGLAVAGTPKRILVTDTLADSGLELLKGAPDVELDYRPGVKGAELLQAIGTADALISRSGTAITAELLDAGPRLKVAGRAGVGLDNVDVDAATSRGILVINAPTANILSATEHTMALLLSLCRNVAAADASVKRGEWNRSRFMGIELSGKNLGVIGLGRIGSRVATRARAFDMRILAYDPYIHSSAAEKVNAEMVPLDQLLAEADFITVHTPLTDETKGMIGAAEIARMKDGVVMINCARGGIYVEADLAAALESGKVAAAAVDVYEDEPPASDHPLLNAKNMILTPHIGANTREAQDRVAVQTVEMVLEALKGSIFVSAVNLPFQGISDASAGPLIGLAEKLGLMAAQLLDGPPKSAEVELWGIEERFAKILTVASLKGLLRPHLSHSVNFVNAQSLAEARGIDSSVTLHPIPHDYTNLVTFRVSSDSDEICISGTLFSEKKARIVSLNNFRVEFEPEGWVLYMKNRDVPGVVGKVGTILGDREINIAEYNLARAPEGGVAMAIVTVDTPVDRVTLDFIRSFKEMMDVRLLEL
ncbi:MAG TPA: phosphoglycerate dehydrogenase [Thermoanaerobaculia bacterium]|nr:phosphoglycerate dehydrogenase [Thermoanaerobaculia bacterium]